MKFPKYIKDQNGDIGVYSHITWGDRPVYKFESGEYKFRQATQEQLANGSDKLNDMVDHKPINMTWKKLSSSMWEAVGRFGKFRIEHSRGKFWASYASEDNTINFRPKEKLSEAKDFCESSAYWEDAA